MGFSIGKALGSVAKVVAAPFTAGASLSGGSLSDIAQGTLFNTASGLPGGDLFGGIVKGAIGLGQDYLQSQVNMNNQKELAAYAAGKQNELNEAAYQRNLQQWNLENAYNSPAAQMQRFAEAGLNPNLIYGQNNYAANSPELKPATYNPGEYQPVDHSAQRQALKIALLEHAQRIENQAIQNDLARQELALRIKASEREDEKLNLLKSHAVALTNSTDGESIDNTLKQLRKQKLEQDLEDNYKTYPFKVLSDGVKLVGGVWNAAKEQHRKYTYHTTGTYKQGKSTFRTYGRRAQ